MKKKILIIDDRKEFRKLVKLYLSTSYDVESAENGLKAMAILQSGYYPDLIVSDLMMPDLNGSTLIVMLKSSGVFKDIPVIVLSSIDKSTKRVELLKSGADDYLIKPFNPEELHIKIQKLLKIGIA